MQHDGNALYQWLKAGLAWRYRSLVGHLSSIKARFLRRPPENLYAGKNGDYDAARYWSDRHRRYLHSFRGVGDLSRSEAQNVADYSGAAAVMADLLRSVSCDPRGKSMLDIGCGNGFWAGVFREWRISKYTGVDITDALFPLLRDRYPAFHFLLGDLLELPFDRQFDLITMIDVTQHIVDDARLQRMLIRIRSLMSKDGVFIVTFWDEHRPQENFYEKFRLFSFYTDTLRGLAHTGPIRFRDKHVAAFYGAARRPDASVLEPLAQTSVGKIADGILYA